MGTIGSSIVEVKRDVPIWWRRSIIWQMLVALRAGHGVLSGGQSEAPQVDHDVLPTSASESLGGSEALVAGGRAGREDREPPCTWLR